MLKWYSKGFDNLSRVFMWGKLKITVWCWEKDWDYFAVVSYKDNNYYLPDDLNTLFDNVLSAVDYKYDVAKIVYEKMELEVNQLLAKYQMDVARMNVVQFQFPPAREAPRYTISAGTTYRERITGWAYGYNTTDWQYSSGTPMMNYLTQSEYERKRENWELEDGHLYLVYTD